MKKLSRQIASMASSETTVPGAPSSGYRFPEPGPDGVQPDGMLSSGMRSPSRPEPLDWFATGAVGSDLRTRYSPQRRFASAFFSLAPWLDVLLLSTAFILFGLATALVPGQPVRLPDAPFADGAHTASGIPVVLCALSPSPVQSSLPGIPEIRAAAFLEDERFLLNNPSRIEDFKAALQKVRKRRNCDSALLYMDRDLAYGELLRISSILRESGYTNVCFVTSSHESRSGNLLPPTP